MGMRYSLKRLLLEQADAKSLVKNTKEETKLQIARILDANGFSTKGEPGEDIVALLTGGVNTSDARNPTVFLDVIADNVAISVKGASTPGKRHESIANDNIRLNAKKLEVAGSGYEDVALIIVTASKDHKKLILTIFGPTVRENAIDVLKDSSFERSFTGLERVFGTLPETMTIDLPIDKNAEAMKKIYDIPRVVSQKNTGDDIANYLQGVADEIRKIWQDPDRQD
jgi:hypothetical protein